MVEEGTSYVCKPKDAHPQLFTVQMVLPEQEGQPAPHRVLNEFGMVCYLVPTADSDAPYACIRGLVGDGDHPSEVLATPS